MKLKFDTRYRVTCLDLVNSSVCLFNRVLSLFFMMVSFSSRHRLHLLEPALWAGTFLSNDHLIVNGFFAAFSSHTCFDSSVSVEYFLFASDLAWYLNFVLKSLAVTPIAMYFTGLLLSAVTSTWYTTLFVRHLPSAGYLSGCLQLHCRVFSVLLTFVCLVCLFSTFLLCPFMNEFMLSRQLLLIRTLCRLKILCSLLEVGKCLSISWRNRCPMFVLFLIFTFVSY